MKIRKKIVKRITIFTIIILSIYIMFWALPTFILKRKNISTGKVNNISTYNLIDLIQYSIKENLVQINNDTNHENIYESKYDISIDYESKENIECKAFIYLDNVLVIEQQLVNGTNLITLNDLSEGTHSIKVEIEDGEVVIKSIYKTVSYIKKYEEQFLDEFNKNGVSWHIENLTTDEMNKAIELQKSMGIQTVRIEIKSSEVIDTAGKINFKKYDDKMLLIEENNINAIVILDTNMGTDKKITNDEEMEKYKRYVTEITARYPFLEYFEICNEPNWYYKTDEEINMYVNVVNETRNILPDKTILVGCTMQYNSDSWSEEDKYDYDRFLKKITEYGAYSVSDVYTYHVYSLKPDNNEFSEYVKSQNEFKNSIGGFQKFYITETGLPSIERIGEEKQAETFVQQKNLLNAEGIKESITYNFRNTGTNIINYEHNYGLLKIDYTPKLSYYAMKNYYENTNGSEYIGTVNLADGLEAHVYDKDGKPKIIAWSDNTDNTITIPYEDFTASDIYGNEIENTSGTLEITTSPVYLDNISNKYFYEAISNTALEKYAEFEEKFSTELSSINGIDEKINELKNYMSAISSNTTETQDTAIKMMSEHFALGNTILNAYKNGMLDVEYVKVSSMLDMLNDIGDSYEDLLTVSATAREAYYAETQKLIDSAEKIINDNADLDIVYPTKILDFAKELDEKSEYINSLEEENDIKTGLIVSNSLHAYYLADWANEFAKIYVEKYIEENPVTVSYSNTDEFTNQDVIATLNIGSDSKVTNNNESNTYTFTKNDTFTFEYERRGQAYTLEATVSNIDKDAPKISGVENGKIYINNARPIITDEHLLSVELLFNGIETQYTDGMTLSAEGIYNITATDKAGNSTAIEMYIVEEGPDSYIVQNNYILNVRQKTTAEQFADKFNLSSEYSIIRNDTNLPNDNIIATGDVLELRNGATYTIIVAGDINCDGKVTTYDLSTLRRYILNLREFNELESLAADINVDGQELGVKDYSRMRIEILGRY